MSKYLHIGFNFEGRPSKEAELKPIFDRAIDWIRYAPNCWIVYTSSSPQVWFDRIKPKLHKDDGFVIVEIDPKSRHGFERKEIWEWLEKDRSKK